MACQALAAVAQLRLHLGLHQEALLTVQDAAGLNLVVCIEVLSCHFLAKPSRHPQRRSVCSRHQ